MSSLLLLLLLLLLSVWLSLLFVSLDLFLLEAFIPMLNKFHKQTKTQTQNLIRAWKMYVVRGSNLTVDKVIITKILKGCKNWECYVPKKIQETNIGFSNWSFFFCFFSPCFFCVHYFSFGLLTIIRATKRQRTRINKHQISIKLWLCHHDEIEIKRLYWIFRKII